MFAGSIIGICEDSASFFSRQEVHPTSLVARCFLGFDDYNEALLLARQQGALLDPQSASELAKEAIAWASVNGFQMAKPDDPDAPEGIGPVGFVHVPFSLLPNAVPRSEFDRAVRLAPLLNLLVDAVANDPDWLLSTLAPVLESDPFTARLCNLMVSSPRQSVRLGLHRSDYMVDGPSGSLLQIELNTIASSFGCVSARATALHRHLLGRFLSSGDGRSAAPLSAALDSLSSTYRDVAIAGSNKGPSAGAKGPGFDELTVRAVGLDDVPPNPSLDRLAAALAAGHQLYCKRRPVTSSTLENNGVKELACPGKDPVVLFVVQAGERNVVDQRLLEFALWEQHGVRVKRATLADVESTGVLSDDGGTLLLHGEEVRGWHEKNTSQMVQLDFIFKCKCVQGFNTFLDRATVSLVCPGESRLLQSWVHPRGLPLRGRVGGPRAFGAVGRRQVPDPCLPPRWDQKGGHLSLPGETAGGGRPGVEWLWKPPCQTNMTWFWCVPWIGPAAAGHGG